MHPYSTNRQIPKWAEGALIFISICLGAVIGWGATSILNSVVENEFMKQLVATCIGVPSALGIYQIFETQIQDKLWRRRWVRRLLQISVPDLNGEWEVCGQSNHANGTEFGCTISVEQTLTQISICLTTSKSKSKSISASLRMDSKQRGEIHYIYDNEPALNDFPDMTKHLGAAMLNFQLASNSWSFVDGKYFTSYDRKNQGDLTFVKKLS